MTTINSRQYLFTEPGLAALRNFIDNNTLFAFDLDGTLAPIVADPGDICIPESILAELIILQKKANVAVITGRSRCDAQLHLGFVPHYLIGNHGAEGLLGLERQEKKLVSLAQTWEIQIKAMMSAEDNAGLIIENKGATISIHYRGHQAGDMVHSRLLGIIERLVPRPRRISGKYIENLIPENAPGKGVAMLYLMHHAGCAKGLFVGDDETDESVFTLPGNELFTVRVGGGNKTKARYFLQDQEEVSRLLQEINLAKAAI